MRTVHRVVITGDILELNGDLWKVCTGPCGQTKSIHEFGFRRMQLFQDVLRVQPQCRTCRGEYSAHS